VYNVLSYITTCVVHEVPLRAISANAKLYLANDVKTVWPRYFWNTVYC